MRAQARHQLKQDKFAENVAETYSWAVEHRNKLISAAVIAVVALAVALGVWAYVQHQDAQASEALGAALRVNQAPVVPAGTPAEGPGPSFTSAADRSRAAHAQFAQVASQYAHTNSGHLARYFAGVTSAELGDYAGAESDLKAAIDSSSADVSALAKMALASVYRNTNRLSKAVELYKQLIAKPTDSVPKAAAQLQLADTYQASQPAEAAKIYAEIVKEDPQGIAGRIASAQLQSSK